MSSSVKGFLLSFCLLSLSSFAFAKAQPILIQGAMTIETDVLIAKLENKQATTIGAWQFWEGEINGFPVVVSQTEVGYANAAAATTIAIERFKPMLIVNQGTAGGHDKALRRGDIVIAKESVNMGAYQVDYTEKGKGIHPTQWHPLDAPMRLRIDGKEVTFASFTSDKTMVEKALSLASSYPHGKVVSGVIGSADQWNREIDRINWLHETYNTAAEEMETAAVALVAKGYQVPFIGIRVLSNTDVHNEEFLPETATNCQNFVINFVENVIAEQN